jgi:hypothetical protein
MEEDGKHQCLGCGRQRECVSMRSTAGSDTRGIVVGGTSSPINGGAVTKSRQLGYYYQCRIDLFIVLFTEKEFEGVSSSHLIWRERETRATAF